MPSTIAFVVAHLRRATNSGPRVARLFGFSLAGAWLVAWWSIGIQLLPLSGRHGLLSAHAFFARARAAGSPTWWQAPSHLWLWDGDAALILTVVFGLLSASAALVSLQPRRALMLSAGLYVGLAAPLGAFFPMLGDKLLLEATLIALLLSRERPSPWAHWLARLLVIKLYLHVGASQWLAPHNDWQTGSALGSFLATTPLPTPLAWWADHLPSPLLSLATKLVLLIELFAPFCLLGPRPLRLGAAFLLSAVQVLALVLVNYGLFAFVAVALHLFFLDERDVDAIAHDLERVSPRLGRWLARSWAAPAARQVDEARVPPSLQAAHAVVLAIYVALGLASFWEARHRFGLLTQATAPIASALGHWQLVHAYTHLQSPAGVRAEPIFERRIDGEWRPVELWRQPGDLWRAPSFVAPHLPRLDVALSAWGQQVYSEMHPATGAPGIDSTQVVLPDFVGALLEQLCTASPRIARLTRTELTRAPQGVRLMLYRYDVASWDVHRDAGLWWTRAEVAALAEHACPSGPGPAHD